MKNREFTMREVVYRSGDYPDLFEVIRVRTSNSTARITIIFLGKEITISNEDELIGDAYEQIAIEFGRTIEEAALDPCKLK